MMYLLGWLDSSMPGYRSLTVGGSTVTIPSAYQCITDAVSALDTELDAHGWGAAILPSGRVEISGSPAGTVAFPDRLGWLLGFAAEPGDSTASELAIDSLTSPVVAPAIIPLYGGDWASIDLEVEKDFRTDRQGRGHGYIWLGAHLWRLRLVMTHEAVAALQTGWCLRGRVTLARSLDLAEGAWAHDNPGGYVDAHVVRVESIEWKSDARTVAEVTMIVTREVDGGG